MILTSPCCIVRIHTAASKCPSLLEENIINKIQLCCVCRITAKHVEIKKKLHNAMCLKLWYKTIYEMYIVGNIIQHKYWHNNVMFLLKRLWEYKETKNVLCLFRKWDVCCNKKKEETVITFTILTRMCWYMCWNLCFWWLSSYHNYKEVSRRLLNSCFIVSITQCIVQVYTGKNTF